MNMEVISTQGYKMKLFRWGGWNNVDVIFEDGTIVYGKFFHNFLNGRIYKPGTTKKHLITINNGLVYGRLTIICDSGERNEHGRVLYLCKCECGREIKTTKNHLTHGKRSCGCLITDFNESRTLPNRKSEVLDVIRSYKDSAKRRGLKWNLSYEFVEKILQQPCYYCGTEKSNCKKSIAKSSVDKYFRYNGIDRINSNKGYYKNNVVPCCKNCNVAKMDKTQKEFYDWVQRISEGFTIDKVS